MATPNPRMPWGRVIVLSAGVIATGWVLMKAIVPSEEQMYNSLSPDLKRQADAIRAARRAQENTSTDARTQAARQQLTNPDPDKPVWAK